MKDSKENWWMEVDHQTDIEKLEGFKETKELLQDSDDVTLPGDDFFDNLHDKIMSQVAVVEIKKDQRSFFERYKRVGIGFSAAAMVIGVMMFGLQTQKVNMVASNTDLVLTDAVNNSPDIEQTILVYQNKDDFFVDLAQENPDHLSVGLVMSETHN
jgi:hypothetical protein